MAPAVCAWNHTEEETRKFYPVSTPSACRVSVHQGDVPCSSLWKQLQDMKDNMVAQEERLRQQMSDHSAALEAKQKTAEEKLGQQMSDQSTALEVKQKTAEKRLGQQMTALEAKQKTAEEQLRRQNADCKAELESRIKTIESRMGRRSENIYSLIITALCSSF